MSLFLGSWISPVALAQEKADASNQPNVLVIMSDELRPDHLGCYGNQKVKTPNIDRLAAAGIVFENVFVEMPVSGASRPTIITGRLPHIHKARQNRWPLSLEETTLTEVLKAAGYTTGAIVSNINVDPGFGFDQGFDTYEMEDEADIPGMQKKGATPQEQEAMSQNARVTKAALEWLEKHKAEKFFAWVDYLDPHGPLTPPPPYDTMYGNPDEGDVTAKISKGKAKGAGIEGVNTVLYDGEITFLDKYIGILLDAVDKAGIADKTLVVFVSDHGEMQGEHGLAGKPACLYDPLIRVPLIFRYPPLIEKGRKAAALAQSIDIAPTILDVVGVQPPAGIQGMSQKPVLEKKADKVRDVVFCEHMDRSGLKCLRTSEWKYIFKANGEEELYNLKNDPGENNNLAATEKDRAAQMKTELLEFLINNEDTLPGHKGEPLQEVVKKRMIPAP